MVLGYVAELQLKKNLEEKGIKYLGKSDDHDRKNKGDLRIQYKGHTFVVESKSLQTNYITYENGVYSGKAQVDASDKRTVTLADGTSQNTTLLLYGEFDLLAVNCFGFGNQWRFLYAKNSDLPHSTYKKYPVEMQEQLIASLIPVTYPPVPPFREDPFALLDEIIAERESGDAPKPLVIEKHDESPKLEFEIPK